MCAAHPGDGWMEKERMKEGLKTTSRALTGQARHSKLRGPPFEYLQSGGHDSFVRMNETSSPIHLIHGRVYMYPLGFQTSNDYFKAILRNCLKEELEARIDE